MNPQIEKIALALIAQMEAIQKPRKRYYSCRVGWIWLQDAEQSIISPLRPSALPDVPGPMRASGAYNYMTRAARTTTARVKHLYPLQTTTSPSMRDEATGKLPSLRHER